jgi:hypothetical protein
VKEAKGGKKEDKRIIERNKMSKEGRTESSQ